MKSPRKPKTAKAYAEFKKQKLAESGRTDHLDLKDETVVKEYIHWLIILNRFPYDAMTSVNHMLVPRRAFEDYYKANEDERKEYHEIIKELAADDYYDAIVENFPKSRSISRHNHVHLIRWKYNDKDGKNKSGPT